MSLAQICTLITFVLLDILINLWIFARFKEKENIKAILLGSIIGVSGVLLILGILLQSIGA